MLVNVALRSPPTAAGTSLCLGGTRMNSFHRSGSRAARWGTPMDDSIRVLRALEVRFPHLAFSCVSEAPQVVPPYTRREGLMRHGEAIQHGDGDSLACRACSEQSFRSVVGAQHGQMQLNGCEIGR